MTSDGGKRSVRKRLRRLVSGDIHLRDLLRGSAISFLLKVASGIALFGMNVILSRMLGASESGAFFLAFTLMSILALVGRLGLDNTVVRFLSAFATQGDQAGMAGVYRLSLVWTLLASTALAALVFAASDIVAEHLFGKPALKSVLAIGALSLPFWAVLILQARALQGLRRIAPATFFLSAAMPLAIIAIAWGARPRTAAEGAVTLVVAVAVCAIAATLVAGISAELRQKPRKIDNRSIRKSSLPLLTASVLQQTMAWAALFFLGAYATTTDAAIYNAAQRTAMLITLVLLAVNAMAAPQFAQLYQLGDMPALRRLAKSSTWIMILVALAPLSVLLLVPAQIMGLFGDEFPSGATALRILAVAQFVNVATGSVGVILAMTGHERVVTYYTAFGAILAVALAALLIPPFGVLGAAISTAAAVACMNLAGAVQVWRLLAIRLI